MKLNWRPGFMLFAMLAHCRYSTAVPKAWLTQSLCTCMWVGRFSSNTFLQLFHRKTSVVSPSALPNTGVLPKVPFASVNTLTSAGSDGMYPVGMGVRSSEGIGDLPENLGVDLSWLLHLPRRGGGPE